MIICITFSVPFYVSRIPLFNIKFGRVKAFVTFLIPSRQRNNQLTIHFQ